MNKTSYAKMPSKSLPDGYIKGTTGAGDAFGAGIVYAAYKGMSLEDALKLGSACAAYSLSEEDSNSGMRAFSKIM